MMSSGGPPPPPPPFPGFAGPPPPPPPMMMGFGGKLEIYFHHVIIQFIAKLYLKCHNIYVRNKNMLLLNLLKKSNGVKLVDTYIFT
jgi:hypothetical protein